MLQLLLLSIAIAWLCWFVMHAQWWMALPLTPVILYFFTAIIGTSVKSEKTLSEFAEAIAYHDYSVYYNVTSAPGYLQSLYNNLNNITSNIKTIIKEKKAEELYMRKILDMVKVGIISYNTEDGNIIWINDFFKRITCMPYAKSIDSIGKRNPELYAALTKIKPGQSEIFTFKHNNDTDKLLMNATAFRTTGQLHKLISLQNVNDALDANETKAWQKLLHVMTHEIMNSVAPISSLADTLMTPLTAGGATQISTEDVIEGLQTIKKRSEALQRFAITYRNLNKITKPNTKEIYIREMFANIQTLMQPTLDHKDIELEVILKDTNLKVEADGNLIEQVLINLITNAMDAVKETANPVIILSAEREEHKTQIKVADNGKGISAEIADQIFIPFFSTRKNGNGIGLSLCKQIMALHKGSIQMQSIDKTGSVFIIQFEG